MSIIIKDMEMPEDCRVCPMLGYEPDIGRTRCIIECRILAEHYKTIPFDGRPEWCPLIELPSHGRLIDMDYLKEHLYQCERPLHRMFTEIDELFDVIDNVPTVLEAEVEE